MEKGEVLTLRVTIRDPAKASWIFSPENECIQQTGVEVRAMAYGDVFKRDYVKERAIKKVLDRDFTKEDFTKLSCEQEVRYDEYEDEEELLREALETCDEINNK